jgi:hypothetical protein
LTPFSSLTVAAALLVLHDFFGMLFSVYGVLALLSYYLN